jgi:hypothetical protein
VKLRSNRSALHARAELIIPWLANESLAAEAEPAVRQHIASCPECREDYEEQRVVCQAMRADSPLVFAAEPSYQKLLARIQNPESGREPRTAAAIVHPWKIMRPFRHAPTAVRWLAAAVMLQAFAIGVGTWAWHSSGSASGARYVTLTSGSPSYDSGPRVRIVFKADLSVRDLQTLLQGSGAHIIDGPADGDVYTLGFAQPPHSAAALERQIANLRANSAVLFAEPVQKGVR